MWIYLFLLLILLLPALITLKLGGGIRRGCGRGCATCGNRAFCHRRKNDTAGNKTKDET